jgi:hypothetical protein
MPGASTDKHISSRTPQDVLPVSHQPCRARTQVAAAAVLQALAEVVAAMAGGPRTGLEYTAPMSILMGLCVIRAVRSSSSLPKHRYRM